MPFAKSSGGGDIYFEVRGEGPPVLLVAGIGGVSSYWKPQIECFAERFQVVLHDHRGTGRSSRDRIDYSVPLMTDDMIAVMNHLEIGAANIVGHSTGAAMAMDMALRYPDRIASTVLYAAWIHRDPYFARVFDIRKELLLRCGPLAYVKTTPLFLSPPWWVSKNIAQLEAEEPVAAAELPPAEIMVSRIDAICSFAPGRQVRNIRCPVLVTCARDDRLTPIEFSYEIARLIPGADSFYFDTGGHAVSQTMPAPFNDLIISWLEAAIERKRWVPPS